MTRQISDNDDLDSKEYIVRMLDVIKGATTDDAKTHDLIADTLLKLPYDVRKKTLGEVLFIFGSYEGELLKLSLPVVIAKDKFQSCGENYISRYTQPVIMLNFEETVSDIHKMSTIAHEIAHFILGHLGKEDKNIL